MSRKFCLIRKYVRTLSGKDTFIYFNDIEKPFDTFGQYGFTESSSQVVRVPFTLLELINILGSQVFYNKCEFNYNKNDELVSIKCCNHFLAIKGKDYYYSRFSQKEINKLMKDNFG